MPTPLTQRLPLYALPAKPQAVVDVFIPAWDAQPGTLQFVPTPFESPVVYFVASGRGTASRTLAYYVGVTYRAGLGAVESLAACMQRLVGRG